MTGTGCAVQGGGWEATVAGGIKNKILEKGRKFLKQRREAAAAGEIKNKFLEKG